jgi:hypothetical protein
MPKPLVKPSGGVFAPFSDPLADLPERDIVAEAPGDLDGLLVIIASPESKRERISGEMSSRRASKFLRIVGSAGIILELTPTDRTQ